MSKRPSGSKTGTKNPRREPTVKPGAKQTSGAKAQAATRAAPRAASAAKAARPRREPGPLGRAVRSVVRTTWRLVWLVGSRVAIAIGLILAVATAYSYSHLPSSDALFDGRGGGSVTMLDRHGDVFAWRGEQYGGDISAADVSPHLVHAVIATEDRRFWLHPGLDPIGLARAIYVNIRAGRLVQGGSTLTQQVAKNVFLTNARTLERKLSEVPMALALELKYTKEEILSVYLNRVYLGAGTYGFEAASQRYFGKSARLVNPAEAAMLAGLLRAPSRYAPTTDLARAQGRAAVIVRLMEAQGYLSETQVVTALSAPAVLSQAAAARAGGYFADWVMETAPAFLAEETTEDVTIETTFDPRLQAAAEEAVAQVFETKVREDSVAQAAVVIMDRTGAVRAMVGGRAAGVGQFNRATQALRQTGSAFKPVVYAAGLEMGMRPEDILDDAPITVAGWSPANYSRAFRGPVTMREALAQSINTVAVQVSQRAGLEAVRDLAGAMGLDAEMAPGPAIALGTSEATLVDMTGVYATIANLGLRAEPLAIRTIRLRGDDEPIMQGDSAAAPRALSEGSARLLIDMMRDVVTTGTGRRAALGPREAAGKTGTTQGARDAWFIGFTGDYVAGVWMGNDDNAPLTGVTGGGLPAEIWRETMLRAHEDRPLTPLPRPEGRDWVRPPDARVAANQPVGREQPGVMERVIGGLIGAVLGRDTAEQTRSEAPRGEPSEPRSFQFGNDR
ncbi:MAG: PBP1A family penicillin-binding protein [Pseudomonadota bacterium]